MQNPAGIRQRKRPGRNKGDDIRLVENAESDFTNTSTATSDQEAGNQVLSSISRLKLEDGSQDELADTLASKLICRDEEADKLTADSRQTLIESVLQGLTLTSAQQQSRKHLPRTSYHYDGTTNNNITSSSSHSSKKRPRKRADHRVAWRRSPNGARHYEETDHDHDGDIEKSDDDGDDRSGVVGTIHSNNLRSTGYNADESLSPHCVDSDDKSGSTISLYNSSDKPISWRPRMRTAIAGSLQGDSVLNDSDKLYSESENETLCICGGVQDQKFAATDGDSSLRSRLDRDRNNNNLRVCRCSRQNHLSGEKQPYSFDLFSKQKVSQTPAKCSESSGWSRLLLWITSPLRPLLTPRERVSREATASSPPSTTTTTTTTTRRRKSKRLLEPNRYSVFSNKRAGDEPTNLIEWQKQQSGFMIGNNQRLQSSMPNSTNYGSGTRYQSLPGSSKARRISGSMSRNRRASTRTHESDGYLRLGAGYHQKAPEPSLLQELKRIVLLLLIVAICGLVLWQIYEILIEEPNFLGAVKFSPSVLGEFNQFAVATDAEPCSRVGKNLMAKGGHAVDAALGTLICMGIALPNSLGLGGGCLMTIYDNVTKRATIIDGREIAPDYATETMFAHDPLSASRGPLSTGVPGELAAYWEAHKRFGRLPWAMLFEESIKMAEEGFPTVEHLSAAFRNMAHAKFIRPEMRQIFTNNATGDYYREGEIMKLPQLAETLKRIRDNGVDEFYNGTTGQLFIEDLKNQGGKMTMDNLRKYKAQVRQAAVVKLDNDLTVYTQPIPGSGLVLTIILRILKGLGYYKNQAPRNNFEASALYYHHLTEAFKFAYAQRAGLEDQPDDPARMGELIANITSDAFIRNAIKKINDSATHPSHVYGGLEYFQEDHGTAHASVIDNEGNSVAITTSVNLYFGSGLVSPRTGIIYNDVMDDFTSPNITNKFALPPSKYNRIRPGKRPLSSMAPSIFVDSKGNPKLIIGASGGAKITSAIATVALRNVFFDEDLKTAVDGPRIHHQFLPQKVWYEANFSPDILASLRARGHELQLITDRSSIVMGIACNYSASGAKLITANSDYRKGGSVDGQ